MITPEQLAAVTSFETLADLFYNQLNWPTNEWPILENAADLYQIPPDQIAGIQELKLVLPLDESQTWAIVLVEFGDQELKRSQLRRVLAEVATRARQRHANITWPSENILFICRSQGNAWTFGHFAGETFAKAKLEIFGWSNPRETRTVTQRNLPELDWACPDRWVRAWDVETLSKDFFSELFDLYNLVAELYPPKMNAADRQTATQRLINRLLFVCFLQEKKWVEWQGSRENYLFALYDSTDVSDPNADTFSRKLELLFFSGFATENATPGDRRALEAEIGRVPFLNGGLFDRHDVYDAHRLPNRAYANFLGPNGTLRTYNFTVEESTPLDVSVAIDPEMLGKVFEQFIIKRHATGSYYTPRPIVAFMCREALKGYLESNSRISPDKIRRLVDEHDPASVEVLEARALRPVLLNVKFCDPACGSGAYLVGMLEEIFAIHKAIDTSDPTAATDYDRKKAIIENCLYGVDIEPLAVNIAWLRIWLSLVIESELHPLDHPEDAKKVALPNLDLKLATGDSVASGNPQLAVVQTVVGKESQSGLDFEGVDSVIDRLKDKRAEYAETHGRIAKAELLREINRLKADIQVRVSITGIAPDAFLWPVEFPEIFLSEDPGFVKGFNIVLANPPYINSSELGQSKGAPYKSALAGLYPDVGGGSVDLLVYFFDRSLQLLKSGGQLSFITSNKWLKADYGKRLRGHLASRVTLTHLIDFGDQPVFQGVMAYPLITLAVKSPPVGANIPRYLAVAHLNPPYPDINRLVAEGSSILPADSITGETWTLADAPTLARLRVMRQRGIPLNQYVNGQIYYGIKTGLNEAFVIDGAKRAELIAADPRSAEIIKPLAIGKDISRWQIRMNDRWLIVTKVGVDMTRYPAVMAHLSGYEDGLRVRQDQGNHWWELRACAYYPIFEGTQLMWGNMSIDPPFTISEGPLFVNAPGVTIPTEDRFLLGVLNSTSTKHFLDAICIGRSGGYLEYKPQFVRQIPIPTASAPDRAAIEALVQQILTGKAADPDADVTDLESQINDRVEFLYFHQTGDETYDQWKARIAAEAGTVVGEARALITAGESARVEFKETLRHIDPATLANVPENQRSNVLAQKREAVLHSALKTIAAFLNQGGGTLLIGVHDNGTPIGIARDLAALDPPNKDKFELTLRSHFTSRFQPNPVGLVTAEFPELDGAVIAKITVQPTALSVVTYLDNKLYVRDGNQTNELTGPTLTAWLHNRQDAS